MLPPKTIDKNSWYSSRMELFKKFQHPLLLIYTLVSTHILKECPRLVYYAL